MGTGDKGVGKGGRKGDGVGKGEVGVGKGKEGEEGRGFSAANGSGSPWRAARNLAISVLSFAIAICKGVLFL